MKDSASKHQQIHLPMEKLLHKIIIILPELAGYRALLN
jgi:hypothetical protein